MSVISCQKSQKQDFKVQYVKSKCNFVLKMDGFSGSEVEILLLLYLTVALVHKSLVSAEIYGKNRMVKRAQTKQWSVFYDKLVVLKQCCSRRLLKWVKM